MLSEASLCLRWLEECGRIDPIYPTEEGRNLLQRFRWTSRDRSIPVDDPVRYGKWCVRINDDGHLIFQEAKRTVELARFVGERRLINQHGGAVLLNGNGFTSEVLQGIQTRLRDRARGVFNQQRVMIVPYQALTGAELQYDTILPIHISGDTYIDNKVYLSIPPHRVRPRVSHGNRRELFRWGGREWETRWLSHATSALNVMHQPPNGTPSMHLVHGSSGKHYFVEHIHNLGSSVFTAVGPDGERHRYISAFDTQETTPMYFLAQLPDEGKCESYVDALNLLAPPIVHQARSQGRMIYRQGDVFAVETNMKDTDFPEGTKFFRRDKYFNGMTLVATRRAARQLMIYGTAHTASIVAVQPDGVTFLKGTMFHDPALERAGREREHRIVTTSQSKWHLACRNTVPRAIKQTKENSNEHSSSN